MILKEGKEGKGKKNYTERARTMKERKKERKHLYTTTPNYDSTLEKRWNTAPQQIASDKP